ncbi:MAG: hypothetical protein ACPGXY_00540 [Alphaproteobacteria bacterium]
MKEKIGMQNVLSIGLILTAALALAGCGKTAFPDTPKDTPDTSEQFYPADEE